jgi:AraC family transcriptional regulator of adaptative response / DNA-3-methyladenine glycosylase II
MTAAPALGSALTADVCGRALDARDARFDGLFFVGITTTRIYCRPVCPARVSYQDRRRFFETAASAERAGFRPCLRCRPELAPGRALIDAVPNLARIAAQRIAAGALNGRGVRQLARELGVSDRHLRRVLERELGVSPVELAQTHRLLLAKRLLADTALPVTRIAFASGFQSLRRFNGLFRERYRLSPSAVRRAPAHPSAAAEPVPGDLVRLTLAYRPPLAWDLLLGLLAPVALPGVETVGGGWYRRTLELEGRRGIVQVERPVASAKTHLVVHVSAALLPALMPLLARLRRLFDLDAEPTAVDAQLARGGLGRLVARHPGLRIPGTIDGFEAVLRVLLAGLKEGCEPARRLVERFGERFDGGAPELVRLAPAPARVAASDLAGLRDLGVPAGRARPLLAAARALAGGASWLEPGSDPATAYRALRSLDGITSQAATAIVTQALHWPDGFAAADPQLQRAAGRAGAGPLLAQAEAWRPWRAYAALHLRLSVAASVAAG